MSGSHRLSGVCPLVGTAKDFPRPGKGTKCQDWCLEVNPQPLKGEVQKGKITRVGADLAKRVIQVHALDASGQRVTGRAPARDNFWPGARRGLDNRWRRFGSGPGATGKWAFRCPMPTRASRWSGYPAALRWPPCQNARSSHADAFPSGQGNDVRAGGAPCKQR